MLECSISYALSLLNTTDKCIPWYYPPVDPKVRMCSTFEARDFNKAIEKMPGGICEVSIPGVFLISKLMYILVFIKFYHILGLFTKLR